MPYIYNEPPTYGPVTLHDFHFKATLCTTTQAYQLSRAVMDTRGAYNFISSDVVDEMWMGQLVQRAREPLIVFQPDGDRVVLQPLYQTSPQHFRRHSPHSLLRGRRRRRESAHSRVLRHQ